jgi:NTE family protein
LTAFEKEMFIKTQAKPAVKNLILLHDERTRIPHFTDQWLKPRNVQRHFHIRPHLIADLQRLARVISGNAIGLVLAGGAPKALHIWVYISTERIPTFLSILWEAQVLAQ